MIQQLTIDQTSDPMATGTMEFYDSGKGFGFIQPDDGGEGAFVHVSALARAGMLDLVEGQKGFFRRRGRSTLRQIICEAHQISAQGIKKPPGKLQPAVYGDPSK